MVIRRGDIYYADLRPVIGSEQGGVRPVLIIQNDIGNRHSPTVICAAITSKMNKAKLPTHVELDTRRCDMIKDSVILLEQLRTIDKQRLKEKICHEFYQRYWVPLCSPFLDIQILDVFRIRLDELTSWLYLVTHQSGKGQIQLRAYIFIHVDTQ